MRIESSVTSMSWIPSESMPGPLKAGFFVGATHYDEAPPEIIGNLVELHTAERFRFANRLAAWIEVETEMTAVTAYAGQVARALDGKIFFPPDDGFDVARRAWNLAVDQRPAAVVFPESASNRLDCAITGRRRER